MGVTLNKLVTSLSEASQVHQSLSKNPCMQEKQECQVMTRNLLLYPCKVSCSMKTLTLLLKLSFLLALFMLLPLACRLCIHLCLSTIQRHASTCQKYSYPRCPWESEKALRVLGIVTHAWNSNIHEADRKMMSSVQPGLYHKFKSSLEYMVRLCLKTEVAKQNPISQTKNPRRSLKTLLQTFKIS